MRVAQKPVSTASSLPSPVGGWNARDALGAMPITDAPVMTNWFPNPTNVILRLGETRHATGITGQVQSLLVYNGASSSKMFAVNAGGSFYDVTSAGAVGAAVVSGMSNGKFQYTNIQTSGGSFMLSVNGANKMRYYDGTTWSADGGTYTVTGVDTSTCDNIALHKNRVWLVKKNTLDVYYLPTSAIQGAAAAFPLGGVAQLGGYIVAIGTWTIDAGYGVDDLWVAVTSQGEVIVYKGTDPSNASTWALVGVWQLGTPVGKRCLMKYAGDLLLICQDGVVPLSGALQSSRTNPRVALTDKIQFAVSTAVSNYGSNFGWQLLYFPKENQLYLNVPVSDGSSQEQYVMNTITRNWTQFTGWAANCWALLNDTPYFGGNGYVSKAWSGYSDNNTNINAFCVQAFSDFKTPNQQKRFTMMRPILYTSGSPTVAAEVNVDFDLTDTTSALSFTATNYASWDSATFDSSVWGTDLSLQMNWQGCTGIGYWAAPALKVAAKGIQVQWNSTTLVYERGGIL